MEQEKLEEYEGIGEYMFNASKSELFVDLRKEALDAALAIQALTAEVRRLQGEEEEPDTESELAVGDKVVTLIRYNNYREGRVGTVSAITLHYEYPFEVDFDGVTVGYDRNELGKVRT